MTPSKRREVLEAQASKLKTLNEIADFLYRRTDLSHNACIVWAQEIKQKYDLDIA